MLDGKACINEEECSGCGLCVDECPSGAIRLES
ncbi:MAG TPA: 4Fe-4S binding protein [Deltaproteobacteria bacterium]|nr:4Fe-4S binding protein [Deltaproteobacteria bacterium]HQO81515.1 4Fe-4S binding protein [Deltaproteobacteria bacterium]